MCARWLGHSALGDGGQASDDEMRFGDLQSLLTQRMGVMIESIRDAARATTIYTTSRDMSMRR